MTTTSNWTTLHAERGVWIHEYKFSKEGFAHTFVVRMADKKLLVLSPGSDMADAVFQELDSLGEVAAIVATNGFHHLGIPDWRRRYPGARCFAPTAAARRIAAKNPDAGSLEPLSALKGVIDADIVVREVDKAKRGELWLSVETPGGHIWFVSDLLANLPHLPESFVMGLVFKWTKSAPGYKVFHLALMFLVKDRRAALRSMLDALETHRPCMVVPAHGSPIAHDRVVDETRALLEAYV